MTQGASDDTSYRTARIRRQRYGTFVRAWSLRQRRRVRPTFPRCLVSGEDQTLDLYEIDNHVTHIPPVPRFRWDYRWMAYPGAGYAISHPRDRSIATLRGHEVRQTLIRAHWSPSFSTGQRYVYSGGADGVVRVWDILTGEVVREMKQHRSLVRDCSWHPHLPHITSVSWDGTVVQTRL